MDWLTYIPKDLDVQVSRSQDFEACASYSFIHILEMILKKKTGYFWEWSERYTAKVTDTQPWGNTFTNVCNGSNTHGIALTQDWPELTYSGDYENIDWATYYQNIPQDVSKRAFRIQSSYQRINSSQATNFLTLGPLWTIIKTGNLQHAVAQINETQFFDSYEIKVKNFSDGYPIISQHALTINLLNMPNAQLVQKAGTNEVGFYLPAMSEDALKDKAMNFGINILKADGTIDYTLAKQITGL